MNIEKYIGKFLLLISDPRNIAPDEFAEYYPKIGEKYNSKNLDERAIEKYFSSLQKFKVLEDWNGYISLKAELYLLLELYEKQSQSDKEIILNYYVLKTKNPSLKTQSFVTEQLLTKEKYYNFLGAYTIFYNNLNSLVINNFKVQIAEHKNMVTVSEKKPKITIENEVKFKIGLLFAMGKMDKYLKHDRKHPDWSASKIEKEIKIPKSREYILATLNNYNKESNNHTKNVFFSEKHLNAILKHCKENIFEVSESFTNRYKLLQHKNT